MPEFLSISAAADFLGVSEQTLRRWHDEGTFPASFVTPGGQRRYAISDLQLRTKGLSQIAREWASATLETEISDAFYCPTSEVFKTRLEKMAIEMGMKPALTELGPIVTTIAGEVGNNSFDHNIGNWPDVRGSFFAYDLGKKIIVLADRGRGVLATLRAVKPELQDDTQALGTAFTAILTGRAPEHRGNGLKLVKRAVESFGLHLRFQSGDAVVELTPKRANEIVRQTAPRLRGSLAVLEF